VDGSERPLTTARVLFFGRTAERLGRAREVAVPSEGCTLGELRARLVEADAAAAEALGAGVRASVDREIVGDEAVVRPGQEVAFFPLFSGG
jgi:molybdopterin synthase sulfur carrier subunit